jgi:hypothetical protein
VCLVVVHHTTVAGGPGAHTLKASGRLAFVEAAATSTMRPCSCSLQNFLAGKWPQQEANDGTDSGSDSDARRASGSYSDAVACLTSDGGASPRGAFTSPSAAAEGFGMVAGSGGDGGITPGNGSSLAARRRRRHQRRRSASRRHSGSTASGLYFPVVHCGSVRQAARVVAMREVALADDAALGEPMACC